MPEIQEKQAQEDLVEVPEAVQQFIDNVLGDCEYLTISRGTHRGGEPAGGEAQSALTRARGMFIEHAPEIIERMARVAKGQEKVSKQQFDMMKIYLNKIRWPVAQRHRSGNTEAVEG